MELYRRHLRCLLYNSYHCKTLHLVLDGSQLCMVTSSKDIFSDDFMFESLLKNPRGVHRSLQSRLQKPRECSIFSLFPRYLYQNAIIRGSTPGRLMVYTRQEQVMDLIKTDPERANSASSEHQHSSKAGVCSDQTLQSRPGASPGRGRCARPRPERPGRQ